MYKEFVLEKEFDGTLFNLIEKVIEAFVNEEIGKFELGEFCNLEGVITLEECDDVTFNVGVDVCIDVKLDMYGVLEEEIIRENVVRELFHKIGRRNIELINDNQIKASQMIRLNSNIKATYTLSYSC